MSHEPQTRSRARRAPAAPPAAVRPPRAKSRSAAGKGRSRQGSRAEGQPADESPARDRSPGSPTTAAAHTGTRRTPVRAADTLTAAAEALTGAFTAALQRHTTTAAPPSTARTTAAATTAAAAAPRDALRDKYAGEPGLALDTWIAKVRRLLSFYDQLSDARAVAWLATGLDGAAGDWFDEYRTAFGMPPPTPAALFTALRSRFQPINAAETARRELDALRQGDGVSVNEYTTRFRALIAHLPATDEGSRVYQYRRGLRATIEDRIAQAEPQPATLEATIALAARIEGRAAASASALQLPPPQGLAAVSYPGSTSSSTTDAVALAQRVSELEALVRSLQSSPSQGLARGRAAAAAAAAASRYDRSDAADADRPSVPGLSSEQARLRMESGRCLYCARSDHIVRHCPDRAQNKPPTLTA